MKLTWMQLTVAGNVRAIRQDALDTAPAKIRSKFTVQALAAELDVDEATYRALEKGRQAIGLDRVLQLARYLEVSPLDLVVPPPEVEQVVIEVAPRGGNPRPVASVPVDEFVLWWRGSAPLSTQHRRRWLMRRGRRLSDPVFADARFVKPQDRVEGRRRKGGKIQEGKEIVKAPLEVPERVHVHMMLEKFWTACGADNDEDAEQALDAIYEALSTGCRRAQGDPHPEEPMWGGRRLPMVVQEDISDERED